MKKNVFSLFQVNLKSLDWQLMRMESFQVGLMSKKDFQINEAKSFWIILAMIDAD